MSRGGARPKQKPKPPPTPARDPHAPPPGTIGVVSGDLGRFTEFSISMLRLVRPPDTSVVWVKGMDVTANLNRIVDQMTGEWLWIMGDDHIFDPLILAQLLSRDVDVVVPLCLQREAPFNPVVYSHQTERADGVELYHTAELPASGIVEVHAAGSAGMLIRRHVLDTLERPVFQTSGFHQNEDLNLCRKIRDAGYTIHCDVDARLGHIGVVGIFPLWVGDRFGTCFHSGDQLIPFYPLEQPEEETAPA